MELKSRSEGQVKILELSGRFDSYTAPQVRQWLEEVTDQGSAQLVLNLTGVHFVDSTALATLVQGMKRCRQLNGGDLRLCCLQQPVRMIFELTRLDKAFEIFASEEAAVQTFDAQKEIGLLQPDF
jgi:anti-sigma B factor antagonist